MLGLQQTLSRSHASTPRPRQGWLRAKDGRHPAPRVLLVESEPEEEGHAAPRAPLPAHVGFVQALRLTNGLLLTTYLSPLTTHHSPLATHRFPLTAYRLPLTAHHSPLTTHHSPLTAMPCRRFAACCGGLWSRRAPRRAPCCPRLAAVTAPRGAVRHRARRCVGRSNPKPNPNPIPNPNPKPLP